MGLMTDAVINRIALRYNRDCHTAHMKLDEIIKRNTETAEDCIAQIKENLKSHTHQFLGFLLVRAFAEANDIPNGGTIAIPSSGKTIRISKNDIKDDQYSDAQRKKYQELFTELTVSNNKKRNIDIDEELWAKRYSAIFFSNMWIEDLSSPDERPFEKQDIICLAKHLNIDTDSTNDILIRLFCSEGLSVRFSKDLIDAFCLDNQDITLKDRDEIYQDYCSRAPRSTEERFEWNNRFGTDALVAKVDDVFAELKIHEKEDKIKLFESELFELSPYLDRVSVTGKNICCLLISLFLNESTGNPLKVVHDVVFKAYKNNDYPQNPDMDRFAKLFDAQWVEYPIFDQNTLRMSSSSMERLRDIVAGREAAQKYDILSLLFIYCAQRWPSETDYFKRKKRYEEFFSKANWLLDWAFLPLAYQLHPYETAIIISILASAKRPDSIYQELQLQLHMQQSKSTPKNKSNTTYSKGELRAVPKKHKRNADQNAVADLLNNDSCQKNAATNDGAKNIAKRARDVGKFIVCDFSSITKNIRDARRENGFGNICVFFARNGISIRRGRLTDRDEQLVSACIYPDDSVYQVFSEAPNLSKICIQWTRYNTLYSGSLEEFINEKFTNFPQITNSKDQKVKMARTVVLYSIGASLGKAINNCKYRVNTKTNLTIVLSE